MSRWKSEKAEKFSHDAGTSMVKVRGTGDSTPEESRGAVIQS